jgi:hypothetical protein
VVIPVALDERDSPRFPGPPLQRPWRRIRQGLIMRLGAPVVKHAATMLG